jgi:hypothetical protein
MAEFKLGRIRFVWKGTWTTGTPYYKDDVARVGGKTYICIIGHTAAADFYTDLTATRWNLLTEGQVWRGNWAPSQFYRIADIVKYGGTVYICNTPHTSAATVASGLEDDLSKWDIMNQSFDYKGTWSNASVRYKLNDVVKYGAGLFICTAYHSSAIATTFEAEESSLRWARFVDGLQFESTWSSSTIYQPGDVVTYGGYAYVSTSNQSNKKPTAYPQIWTILSTGFSFQGDWSTAAPYKIGSIVRLNGYTYLATVDNTPGPSNKPPNTDFWQLLNPGYKWLGTWATGTDYQLGDTVKYGANSYVCILTHEPLTGNRPDNDLSGTYWNLLTGGSESAVLTTQGDTVYYSGAGPARLPIGTDGQVMRVQGNSVTWKTFGAIANVWYCAPSGTDDIANGYGLTIDKPFKTIRYACNNITGPATIFAKTGTFVEVLPIIVPAGVAIVGDELRSTVVTPAGQIIASGDVAYSKVAILRLKAIVSNVIQNITVTPSAGNTVTQDTTSYAAGSAGAGTAAQTKVQNAYDWIDFYINAAGSAPSKTGSNAATTDANYLNAASVLSVNRNFIATEVVQYIKSQYFIYDAVKCSRDVGIIIDSLCYDLVLGTNYNRVTAGLAYQRAYDAYLLANQLSQTVAAITYAKTQALAVSVNSDSVVTAVFNEILDILQNGVGNADALTWTTPSNAVAGAANSKSLLVSNRQFLVDEITAYMNTNSTYSAFWAGLSAGQKTQFNQNMGYIVDALCYDILYGGNSATLDTANSYYYDSVSQISGQQTQYAGAINHLRAVARDVILNTTVTPASGNTTPQVKDVPNPGTATQQTAIDTLSNIIIDVVTYGQINLPTTLYPDVSWGTTNAKADRTLLLTAKSTIQSSTINYINTTLSGYSFIQAACYRDVVEYVKALEYDLTYTGNYKILLAADWYVAAVNGSTSRDMFYLRNGTGVRNMTLSGLSGTLGSANSYGTRRPSAGAYVSLDPGWGPADNRAWITTRSPYVQNVTTFGTGCIGQKIDGNLHNGGNRSIVSNDFTQVLSDGIGAWITNLGRAELVSVFTYYNYIGYLAENGGKIRATNGNNSYGSFGSVSEGIDATETPITGTVNNRAYEAQVDYTFTNGSQILRLEFNNAGSNYTSTGNTFTFAGTGNNNVTAIGDEIRDKAVFEVRLLTGGANYTFVTNTAQTGNSTSITLAGSDTNANSVYVGMRITINSGVGVGQFGYIQAYNSGTKVATVYKISTGTAGWDHVVAGTPITPTLDTTTLYIIEPRATLTAPTYTASARTGAVTSSSWVSTYANGYFVGFPTSGQSIQYSSNGTSWTSGGASAPSIAFTGAAAGNISGTPYYIGVANGSSSMAYTTTPAAAWNTGTMPSAAGWTGVAYGNGRFVAVASGSALSAVSTNGTTFGAGGTLPSTNTWSAIAYGSGPAVFVAVAGNASSTTSAAYSTDGTSWQSATLPSANWTSVTWGDGKFVAVAQGSDISAYSFDGVNWTASTLSASSSWKEVRYGQGTFLAIAGYGGTATTVAASSYDGVNWTARALASASWATVAFGNTSGDPMWAVLATGATTAASVAGFTQARARVTIASNQIAKIRIIEPGSGYASAPTLSLTDPSQTVSATWTVRTGNGALANPTFTSRGSGYTTATTTIEGAGYADMYQSGYGVNVSGLTAIPLPGSNITFAGNNAVYKLVTYTGLLGSTGNYSALIQVSPAIDITVAPEHATASTIRYRYSQVRLTGHDFLSIGTGNITSTNYPGTPLQNSDQLKECVEGGGGRVFFTSTDQDGNFRVGNLFSVEQSTGKSALNANAFNLSGLNELQLGTVTLGSSNTAVNEFSTDGTFAANSDMIVPTQKAVKTYIASQIGGGSASLNVNSITAGQVSITGSTISTTSGVQININKKVNFTQGVDGSPLALNYFFR